MTHPSDARDRAYMRLALVEAERARGMTRPNPMVGAVVVRGDQVVGRGFHRRAGEAHAEVLALRDAGDAARDAEVFISLEPCSHHGRTPPCCDALIRAGVRRVVAAMIDPNPRVSGRGMARLSAAGIQTRVGVLEHEARRLNEAFTVHVTEGRPFVTIKLAVSLDGRIATRTGHSQWITGTQARAEVHRRRATADAVLVGPGTLKADDPSLSARDGEDLHAHQPMRAAIDPGLEIAPNARLLSTPGGPVVLLCAADAPRERFEALARLPHVTVIPLALGADGHLPVPDMLHALARLDIQNLLVEGGGGLAGALLDAGTVDRLVLHMAPMLIGGAEAVPAFGGLGAARIQEATRARRWTVRRLGDDLGFEIDLR